MFDDDFRTDADGEFPAHWKLLKGQGVINIMQGAPVFALTEGNYVEVAPRVRKNVGFGATKPIDSNATPEGKANNRRVELVKV